MTFRFHIQDSDGRRSNEWVIKVAGSNKADVYVAPRSMLGQIKASLHESGECRIGPTAGLRKLLSWRFRQSFQTWIHDRHGTNVVPVLAVAFRADQLVDMDKDPHPDSMAIELSTREQVTVTLTICSPEVATTTTFQSLEEVVSIPLGDGSTLYLHTMREPERAAWLEEVMAFNPAGGVEYPNSLSGSDFGYAFAGTDDRPFPMILELAGETVQAQDLAHEHTERSDRSTSEEYVMGRLDLVRTQVGRAMEQLETVGAVWDGHNLHEEAQHVAEALTAGLEALSTMDSIARTDGADLLAGTPAESKLEGWLDIARKLRVVHCQDPNCPDHTVGGVTN